jgi:hypothetical protein
MLKKLGAPETVDVPENVTVPADALNVPARERSDFIEKLRAVETDPVTFSELKVNVPAPPIVLVEPLIVIVPPVAA